MKWAIFFSTFLIFSTLFAACTNQDNKTTKTAVPAASDQDKFQQGRLAMALTDLKLEDVYVITLNHNSEYIRQDYDASETTIKQNDIVLIIDENGDKATVTMPYGDPPRLIGTVEKQQLTTDRKEFAKANQVHLSDIRSYDKIDGVAMDKVSGPATIEQRQDGWLLVQQVGGSDPFWVREKEVDDRFETTVRVRE